MDACHNLLSILSRSPFIKNYNLDVLYYDAILYNKAYTREDKFK